MFIACAASPPRDKSEVRSIRTPNPRFPPDLWRRGVDGYVVAEFTIGTDGGVKDLAIVDREPDGVFDQAVSEVAPQASGP